MTDAELEELDEFIDQLNCGAQLEKLYKRSSLKGRYTIIDKERLFLKGKTKSCIVNKAKTLDDINDFETIQFRKCRFKEATTDSHYVKAC